MNPSIDEQRQARGHAEERSESSTDEQAFRGRVAGANEASKSRVDWARLRAMGRNLSQLAKDVEDQTRRRPGAVLGAAAGVGFVAGSLFGSKLGQALLAGIVGYLAKQMLEGNIDEVESRLRRRIDEFSKAPT